MADEQLSAYAARVDRIESKLLLALELFLDGNGRFVVTKTGTTTWHVTFARTANKVPLPAPTPSQTG